MFNILNDVARKKKKLKNSISIPFSLQKPKKNYKGNGYVLLVDFSIFKVNFSCASHPFSLPLPSLLP